MSCASSNRLICIFTYDKYRLAPDIEKELGLIDHASVDEMLPLLDILNISCPLDPETQGMVNAKFIARCKRGVFIEDFIFPP